MRTLTLSLICFLLFAAGATQWVEPIRTERRDLQLDVAVPSDLPPEIAIWSVALGSFRGILVDLLWERHTDLQEQGKYFEAVQLGQTITKLQPKFPLVWKFMAWDMAYNISMASPGVQERWQWIQEGIRLLRDEGLRANPWSLSLHSELARFFNHRIAGLTDDTHTFYKRELAREWELFLGVPPWEGEARIERFRGIAEAPRTEGEFLEQRPALRAAFEELRQLGGELDGALLFARRVPREQNPLSGWWSRRDRATAVAIDDFLCAQILRRTYHMDPALMLDVMERVGPVDLASWKFARTLLADPRDTAIAEASAGSSSRSRAGDDRWGAGA